jgi:hypothetical protein
MKNNFWITEENLVGNIASAMLSLKKLKRERDSTKNVLSFIEIIKFIDLANKPEYRDLLYDKNFFVSESILLKLHTELQKNKISDKIDFKILIELLSEIVETPTLEKIDLAVSKLKEIVEILLHLKSQKEIYM